MPVQSRWIGCAAANFRVGRAQDLRPEFVVMHIMDGSLTGTDSWFLNPVAQVSAHYGVGKSGAIHQYVKEADTAFHAGRVTTPRFKALQAQRGANPNAFSIGIEHEGRADSPWSDAMYTASAALVHDICTRWGIPMDADHIVLHREIYAKACPGSVFDRDAFLVRLRALDAPPPPPPPAGPRITLLKATNLRRDRPNRAAPVARVLARGTTLETLGVVAGEPVAGNARWFRVEQDQYIWAGGTDRPQG